MKDFSIHENKLQKAKIELDHLPLDRPDWWNRFNVAFIHFRTSIETSIPSENFVCNRETLLAMSEMLLIFSELLQPPHIYKVSNEQIHVVAYLEKVAKTLKEDNDKILKQPQEELK